MCERAPTGPDHRRPRRSRRRPTRSAGIEVAPVLDRLLGDDLGRLRIEVYDGTSIGPSDATTVVRIASPDFFRRILVGRASELSFARAYVAGEVEVAGDIYEIFGLRDRLSRSKLDAGLMRDVAAVAGVRRPRDLAALQHLPLPPEEIEIRGRLHSKARDAKSIRSHYDVSNDFYRLVLGPSMTYSCAVFEEFDAELADAQAAKHDLICRKLRLAPGMRLLDVGCGWGSMVMHAAEKYGVHAVGVTISTEQHAFAKERVAAAGLDDRIEVRLQDYRDIVDGPFDAISSVGMFEHVGERRLGDYFDKMAEVLAPGGRMLNHAINRPSARDVARIDPDGFFARYVFPDGELLELGQVITAMNSAGLEVRHAESLREHYAVTLRHWVRNLERHWDEAVGLTSLGRARVWLLYMAASAVGFESGEFTVNQVLAAAPGGSWPPRPTW